MRQAPANAITVLVALELFFMELALSLPSKDGRNAHESRSPDLRFSSAENLISLPLTALLRAFPFISNSGISRSQSPLQLRGQWRIHTALPVHFQRFFG
jgi:hypothetical protein